MVRIFRYVFREVLTPTLLGLVIYTFVLLMNAIFNVAEMAIRRNLPVTSVFKLLALSLPQFLALTIPMSVLLGTLIGIGRLSADSEAIAMRACGISYRRILLPVLTLGLLGWMACCALVLWIEPRSNAVRHRLATRLMLRSDLRKELKPRVFFEELPGMLLFADKIYEGGGSLEHVLLCQTDPQGRDLITTARRGHLDYDSRTGDLRLLLEGGLTHRSDAINSVNYQVYGADRQMVLREADAGFKLRLRLLKEPQQKNYREQTLSELSATWQKAGEIDHAPTRRKVRSSIDVVYHERLALPVACIVFVLIGFPLGIYNRRGGKSSGISLSLAVVLVYWFLLSTGENLATEARISPIVGLWTGNVLFMLAGLLLLWRRERKEVGEGRPPWVGLILGWVDRLRHRRRVRREMRQRTSRAPRAPQGQPAAGDRDRYVGGAAFSTLIDRYVLRSYLKFVLVSGLSIYVIFLVVDFREMIDDVIRYQVPGSLILRFFKFRTPWVVNQILPVACLVATLLAFGLLTRFNEITAMKAGGLSLYRISFPVVGMTALLSVLAFGVEGYVMPFSNQRASQIRDQIRGHPARSYSQPSKRWVVGKDGLFYNYRTYSASPRSRFLPLAGGGVFQGFSAYRMDPRDFSIRGRIFSREALWSEGTWTLRDGWERKFGPEGNITSFESFKEKKFPLRGTPSHFLGEEPTPDQMNYWQLRTFIEDLKRRGYSVQELMVGLHEKLALPFVSLVMVFLGLPFAFRAGKKGSLYGIGLSIGLVVVYYATFAVMSALGEIGFLPPFLAAWAPNILFSGVGAYMMLTLVRT